MRTKGVVLFACLLVPTAAVPQVPDTPVGRLFAAWLAAYNSGSADTLRRFLETSFPSRVPMIERDMMMRLNADGGLDLKKVEEASPTRLVAILKMRDLEEYTRVVATVDTAARRIDSLGVMLIPRPPEFPTARTTEAAALDSLRARVERESAAGQFSGAVLVAKHGRPIFSGAYGLADRERHTPNTLDTKFRLGSMNKAFTAVAVLQLVQAGRVNLDDTLGTYLHDYANREIASRVTVGELLQHRGGTGDIFGPDYVAHRQELRTLDDYVKLYGRRGPLFEPGTQRAYSNYGFVLLGVLIERVSGESYYDYVHNHVFLLAHMASTESEPEDVVVPGRAVGYTTFGTGAWHRADAELPYRGTSAGGGYSTVRDLLRFASALGDHTLLDAHHLELFAVGDTSLPPEQRISFGSGHRTWDGAEYFGHNGGFPGMNGDLEIGLSSGYVIVVLANMDPPAAQRISETIGSRLPLR